MSRYIDADKLKEWLEKYTSHQLMENHHVFQAIDEQPTVKRVIIYDGKDELKRQLDQAQKRNKEYIETIQNLKKQCAKSKWNLCKKGYPKEEGYYMTCDAYGNIHKFYYNPNSKVPFGIRESDVRYYVPVAWREMPDPYREEQE